MRPGYGIVCRVHGYLATYNVLHGHTRPSLALRAVRFVSDLYEMGECYGWSGIVDVFRDRLGMTTEAR